MLTAAVINAGIGDLSLGLTMAGIRVEAACVDDKRAAVIHRANMDIPIYPLPREKADFKQFPKVDVLAVRLHLPSSVRGHQAMKSSAINELPLEFFTTLFEFHQPRALFFLVNAASMRNPHFAQFLDEITGERYRFFWKIMDVEQTTGTPVKEHMTCAVGIRKDLEVDFDFPPYEWPAPKAVDDYLQLEKPVDPWYFQGIREDIVHNDNQQRVFCWSRNTYASTNKISWNFLKIPLVLDNQEFRKVTHREIARLKGFPDEYVLPSENRQWLYKALMYAGNAEVIRQLSDEIVRKISTTPWQEQNSRRSRLFEDLFGRYLVQLETGDLDTISLNEPSEPSRFDFVFRSGSQVLHFELKSYPGLRASESAIKAACKAIGRYQINGTVVLVIANEVRKEIREQYSKQFGIAIWDIHNLLWLFDDSPDLKKDLVALLDYATDNIEALPPVPSLIREASNPKSVRLSFKERLAKIKPGPAQSRDYADLCADILQFVLGDYLTLWKKEKYSSGGMYRFDLFCKIKHGVSHEFFDTILRYFGTKYIVFEFKNYTDPIKQGEIYTTEKYLYEKALRKVAILISRFGTDANALQAIKGSLRENGKLILSLSDRDLQEMIDFKENGTQDPADCLTALLDNLLVQLEK